MNAKSLIRLGAFSEQKWVWAWVLNLTFFRDRLGAYKNRFGRHFWSQNGVPRPFSRACFSGFQLRDTIIEKNAPLPGENHVFACWRGLKIGRFEVPKSIKNRYFFDIHLGSVFCWFFDPKRRFQGSKTEAKFQQKSISRRFAWSVEKCIAQAVLCQSQRLGPEASPGGLGGLLSTTY